MFSVSLLCSSRIVDLRLCHVCVSECVPAISLHVTRSILIFHAATWILESEYVHFSRPSCTEMVLFFLCCLTFKCLSTAFPGLSSSLIACFKGHKNVQYKTLMTFAKIHGGHSTYRCLSWVQHLCTSAWGKHLYLTHDTWYIALKDFLPHPFPPPPSPPQTSVAARKRKVEKECIW